MRWFPKSLKEFPHRFLARDFPSMEVQFNSFSDSGVCSYWSLPAPVSRSHHLLLGHGRTRRLCCLRIMWWDCSGPQINLSSEHLGLRTPCPAVDRINKHRGFQSAI
ncbi:hypothetical protein MRX96_040855 [Rhipicephalus microplus]